MVSSGFDPVMVGARRNNFVLLCYTVKQASVLLKVNLRLTTCTLVVEITAFNGSRMTGDTLRTNNDLMIIYKLNTIAKHDRNKIKDTFRIVNAQL